jgi:hypothetical protein
MRFQKQLNMHEPEKGIYGDCLRTVFACLLGLDPADVPHFGDRTDGRSDDDVGRMLSEWVREQGMVLITTQYGGAASLDDVLGAATWGSFGMPFLLSGRSGIGCDHVVICQGGKIIWDPSRIDSGIVGPMSNGMWWVEWLVKPLVTEDAA